jgi:hypothetical protein
VVWIRTLCAAPPDSEVVAAGGELPDQVGESPVVRIAAGLGAQQGDAVVGDSVPVAEELARLRVEEGEPGGVGRPDRVGVHRSVERGPELVGGQDVEASVEHERGSADHRVQHPMDRGPDPLRGGPAPRRAGGARGAEQVEQVRPLGVVEL